MTPATNSITIATALDARKAVEALCMTMNGTATGNVERNTSRNTPRPPHRDIHKTALGATETVAWQYAEKTIDAINRLKDDGYKIFAVEQVEKSIPLHEFSAQNAGKNVVIFGNEVAGVDAEVLKLCDGFIEIPQFGMKHSLNISVAAGIVLWELTKKKIADYRMIKKISQPDKIFTHHLCNAFCDDWFCVGIDRCER